MKYHMSLHNILHFAVEQPPGSTMRLEFFNLNRLCSINNKECTQMTGQKTSQAGPGLMVSGPHPPPNVQADSQDLFMQAHPITPTACVRGIYMVIRIRLVQLLTVTASFLQTCTHTTVRLLSMIE